MINSIANSYAKILKNADLKKLNNNFLADTRLSTNGKKLRKEW